MMPHLIRPNYLHERPRFSREGRLGWLLITRRWVIARGYMARIYA